VKAAISKVKEVKAETAYKELKADELKVLSGILELGATGDMLYKLGELLTLHSFTSLADDATKLDFFKGVVEAEARKTLLPNLISKLEGETVKIKEVCLSSLVRP
jgi:hypothetical protein